MIRHKILAALFLIAGLVTLVRETGLCDFNYYSASSNDQLHTQWNDSSIATTLDRSEFHTDFPSCRLTELPIAVVCQGDTLLLSKGDGPAVVLMIQDIYTQNLWTPLYKRASYQANISCVGDGVSTRVSGGKFTYLRANITGTHHATGETTIIGLSSYRNSLNLIKTLIATQAMNATKQHLSSLDTKYALQ